MQKIFEIFRLPRTKGLLGVEVEAEGNNLSTTDLVEGSVWKTVNDGSLRGNFPDEKAEYVFRHPLDLPQAREQIKLLAKIQKDAELNFSFRTSVHVHVNVQDFTEKQVMNFIYAYYLLEPMLIKYSGEVRKANRFCLGMEDSDGVMDLVAELFSTGVLNVAGKDENRIRYSALNLAALRKYGSLEIRSMRGTLDYNVLNTWITAIANLHKYAASDVDVIGIYDEIVNQGVTKFVKKVLGLAAYKEMQYEEMEHDIVRAMSLSIEIPWLYKIYQGKQEKAELKKKRAEEAPLGRGIVLNPEGGVMLDIPPVDWEGIQRNVRVDVENQPRIDWAMMKRLQEEVAERIREENAERDLLWRDGLLNGPMAAW